MARKRSSQRFEAEDQNQRRSSLMNDEFEDDISEGDDISKFNKRVQSVQLIKNVPS